MSKNIVRAVRIGVQYIPLLFFHASERSGILNPWIWLADCVRSSGPDFPIRTHYLERKDHIKYFGVMIGSALTWKNHIPYVCVKLSRNAGVISKLRHYLHLKQLTQIYYNLIYPYILYAIVAWGSTNKTNLHHCKIQTKQNHVIRLIFFATLSGKNTDSALPLLNILEMLTVANIYRLHALKFIHAWHKGVLPELFNHFFQYASNVHNYNTRYAAKQNLHKFRVNTNTTEQTNDLI